GEAMSDKPKKKKSLARVIVEWSLTIVFGGLFLFAGIAQIDGLIHKNDHYGQVLRFGWGSFVVLTDSMEPDYPVDSAIITYLESPENIYSMYQRGETVDITFYNNADYVYDLPSDSSYNTRVTQRMVFTHRLFEARVRQDVALGEGRYLFFVTGINTQGSAWKSSQYQLLTEKELLGIVKVNSPFLGGFFSVLSSPWGLLLFLLVPAGYLVVVSVMDIFKAMKEPEEATAGAPNPNVPTGNAENPLEGMSEEDKKRLKEEMLAEMMEQHSKGDKK
ncbi:MAG: hypothetical protein K6E59_04890, partial [Bacilli bacterium]|nr:hypothetical protein [Bacilli bacterium]